MTFAAVTSIWQEDLCTSDRRMVEWKCSSHLQGPCIQLFLTDSRWDTY